MMRCVYFVLWVTALTTFTLPMIWALEGQALSLVPFAWCACCVAVPMAALVAHRCQRSRLLPDRVIDPMTAHPSVNEGQSRPAQLCLDGMQGTRTIRSWVDATLSQNHDVTATQHARDAHLGAATQHHCLASKSRTCWRRPFELGALGLPVSGSGVSFVVLGLISRWVALGLGRFDRW